MRTLVGISHERRLSLKSVDFGALEQPCVVAASRLNGLAGLAWVKEHLERSGEASRHADGSLHAWGTF